MAAYAALSSLINNLDDIRNHPRLSTSFDTKLTKSLLKRLHYLLDFTEKNYTCYESSRAETEGLERQIASAAHAAEDAIESHIVDQVLNESTDTFWSTLLEVIQLRTSCAQQLKLDVRKIMKDMDCIIEKAMRIKARSTPFSSVAASSVRTLTAGKSNMVGFEGYFGQILEELIGDRSDRRIIPVVGVGGIGKTTLAKNAYDNSLVVRHFDVRVWVTVSEGYNLRVILFRILSCLEKFNEKTEHELGEQLTEIELGEQLHKLLSGLRYLVVLDDMWSVKVWDEIKCFFPNECNGSRIVVTTRILDVANHFDSMELALEFLDDERSWELFCEKVFVEGICPPELEESGRKIVKRCQGLPLAIVVIGGLLVNSSMTRDEWENVEMNMRSTMNITEDNRCSELLTLSYSHLPACLKPCFLYFGIFAEDEVIRVSRLIRLWVAEGFIRPNKRQSLEEIGEDYINDLVGRNLISVHSLRWNGKFKTCSIHDLVRDMCVAVAEKEKFLCAKSVIDAQEIDKQRHIINHPQGFCTLKSESLARSLICKGGDLLQSKPRLLRVLIEVYSESVDDTFQQVNLRFLAHESLKAPIGLINTYHIPSSISRLWNVQTLIMTGVVQEVVVPSQIWEMPQLRHLKFKSVSFSDHCFTDGPVLDNLQTLGNLLNFWFTENACKRIPNVKKLHIAYGDFMKSSVRWPIYGLRNLILFNKLESLHCHFFQLVWPVSFLRSFVFPRSLKKLTLVFFELEWNDFTAFGSLPCLEALRLRFSGSGPDWNPVEGEFLRLKYLQIYRCNLVCWNANNTHFPVLENLVLEHLDEFVEIPSSIGDIRTLERICLVNCRVSAALSAVKILEEQESLGNHHLQVKVVFQHDKRKLQEFVERVEVDGSSGTNIQIEGG